MYEETKLSDQAQKIEEALLAVPPRYDAADEIFANNSITKEELSKIASDLIDECSFSEQYNYRDDLKELVEDNTITGNIYKIMQYLFSKGYDPNVLADSDTSCAMNTIRYIDYPEGLAPRLMRLFMENGGDPNLVVEQETIFEEIDFAAGFDEYMSRSTVYCWLVLMAYGGRLGKEKYLPLTMREGLDVSIFKRFEDYSYYKIVPEEKWPGRSGYWKILIYDTSRGDTPKLVASSTYRYVDGDLSELLQDELLDAEEDNGKADNSQIEKAGEPESDDVPISEEDFLRKIGKMYSEYAAEDIQCHMEPDFRYSSFFVLSEMTSANEYVDYITAKIQTFKRKNIVIKTKIMHIKGSGKPCLVLDQQDSDIEPGCLTADRSKNGLIARMDIMPCSFYELIP